MKPRYVFTVLLAAASLALTLPAYADGPDYDGTVDYIKSRIHGTLTEVRRCEFHAQSPASATARTFRVSALGIEPGAISAAEIRFECAKAEKCVSAASEPAASSISFAVHNDPQGVAVALSRLIELCGPAAH